MPYPFSLLWLKGDHEEPHGGGLCPCVWGAGGELQELQRAGSRGDQSSLEDLCSLLPPLCCSKHKNGFYLCYRQLLSKARPGSGHSSVSAEMQLQHLGLVLALLWL